MAQKSANLLINCALKSRTLEICLLLTELTKTVLNEILYVQCTFYNADTHRSSNLLAGFKLNIPVNSADNLLDKRVSYQTNWLHHLERLDFVILYSAG
jgi:hypothetical protein